MQFLKSVGSRNAQERRMKQISSARQGNIYICTENYNRVAGIASKYEANHCYNSKSESSKWQQNQNWRNIKSKILEDFKHK